jgi:hypothetical protein
LHALFADNEDAAFFQKAVMETRGVTAEGLQKMSSYISDILGNWESDIPDAVFALSHTLTAAQEFAVEGGTYPLDNFFMRVYPSYLHTITTNPGYYLSDMELFALCRCRNTNVVIVLHYLDTQTMEYHSHSYHPSSTDMRWVLIQTKTDERIVRSHFERLSPQEEMVLLANPGVDIVDAGQPSLDSISPCDLQKKLDSPRLLEQPQDVPHVDPDNMVPVAESVVEGLLIPRVSVEEAICETSKFQKEALLVTLKQKDQRVIEDAIQSMWAEMLEKVAPEMRETIPAEPTSQFYKQQFYPTAMNLFGSRVVNV